MMDDYWQDEEDGEPPECSRCGDSGKVVAADGFHEYLGYSYLPCNCSRASFEPIGTPTPYLE